MGTSRMGRLAWAAGLALALLGCDARRPDASTASVPRGAAPERLGFEELLQTKRADELQLSPEGARLAFVLEANDLGADVQRRTLWLLDIATGALTPLTAPGVRVGLPRWSPDGTQLAYVASPPQGSGRIELLTPGGSPRRLLSASDVTSLAWSPDGARLALTAPAAQAPEEAQLSVVDVASGSARPLVSGLGSAADLEWSPDGRAIAFTAELASAGEEQLPSIQVVEVQTGVLRQASPPGQRAEVPHWSPDGTRLAYLAYPARTVAQLALGVGRLTVVPASGGAPTELAPGFPFLPERVVWSADGQSLFFEAFTRETGQLFTVPASGGAPSPLTQEEGLAFRATYSRDRSLMAFVRESPTEPPEVWLSPGPPRLQPVRQTDFNARLRAFPVGRAEVVSWRSTDGLEVGGILIHPVEEAQGQPAPLLVVSHGGPIESVVMQWMDGWLLAGAQQWANRGWAVFFPNYRGSTRHGEDFSTALIGQVGKGDAADVLSGVDALVSRGVADPHRLAHTGWSYGGFLSGWLLTHDAPFAVYVAGAGPYDWARQYAEAKDPASRNVAELLFEGTPAQRRDAYAEASVSRFIQDARAPTLVMYGEADITVAPSQPQGLHDALVAQGVETDLVVFPGEGHVLARPSHQLGKLQAEQDWVFRHIAHAPPAQ